ncbi:CcdC family protein [Pseudalkalibacillus caeni]|uniref:Cytochrome c biogenesis protein CcdC n=1 Tax=Exobacillus caeni TaxID=2574798 RepID=A0A5R9F345_9BACL|nr:cytochrome c biogenesis protein CcdC [Pseudalkalibacillus caeni]TLS37431.1 cytochrome c biogenesis protein CcdC [Pseudalkalibacillus caeni]
MILLSTIIGAIMALGVIFIRLKASQKPVSAKKIILPPIFMSTGFLMFVVPQTWVPLYEAAEAFSVGAIFSLLLIKTSQFHIKSDQIYLKRSKAFAFILIGLLVFRIALKTYLGQYISVVQTSSLFFILAFGMILPWRVAMYIQYKRMERNLIHRLKFQQTT